MPSQTYPFVDNDYDRQDNPPEVAIGTDSTRFPLLLPKDNVMPGGHTKSAMKLAERLAEANNRGRPDDRQITEADIPDGLLYAFEAADAAPQHNVSNLSAGTIKVLSTDVGELLYADVLLSPFALCHDPMNGRTIFMSRINRHGLLEPTGEDESVHLPLIPVESARSLQDMVAQGYDELGYSGATVKAGKDLYDLVSIGLQGIHEPTLVMPVRYYTPDGNAMWTLVIYDGNRRVAASRRVLREATNLAFSDLHAWDDHLINPDGSAVLRDIDAPAVNALRKKAQLRDFAGGRWAPVSGREDDVDHWIETVAANSIAVRSVVRCRTIPVRLILGVNAATVSPQLEGERSPSMTLVHRVVRRLHIEEAAQKQWSEPVQHLQVSLEALRNSLAKLSTGADFMPMTETELRAVLENRTIDWAGAAESEPMHPLRLAGKVIAEIICDDHDGVSAVTNALRAFGMAGKGKGKREHLSEAAVAIVMLLLGFDQLESSSYNRVATVIDRTFRSRVFYDTDKHPDATKWWELLDRPVSDLVELALVEAKDSGADGDSGAAGDDGVGSYGPATRVLLALAIIAQTASPAVRGSTQRVTGSPFQLTLNGLNGTRGVTKTTPDLVMQRLAQRHPGGIRQLGEIVEASLARRLPKNVIDPEFVSPAYNGGPEDPTTKGLLTEYFLRGESMGWTSEGGPSPVPTPPTNLDQYQRTVDAVVAGITSAWTEAQALVTDDKETSDDGDGDSEPSLAEYFTQIGIPDDPTRDLRKMLFELVDIVVRGQEGARRNQ